MSSANLLGYLNVLDNNIMTISKQIFKIENDFSEYKGLNNEEGSKEKKESNENKERKEIEDLNILLKQKTETLTKRIDPLINDISEIKKELKENSNFIPKVEQLINKCIKDRLEINNNFMNRQIKSLQDQIDIIQKSIDSVEKNVNSFSVNSIDSIDSNVPIVQVNQAENASAENASAENASAENANIDNESNSSKKKRGYNKRIDEKVKQLNIE
jgi:hypothetical protein